MSHQTQHTLHPNSYNPIMSTVLEHPILMSAPMVLATLNGTKTQTRRIVKPYRNSKLTTWGPEMLDTAAAMSADMLAGALASLVPDCPYGRPGDRLWVRETCKAAELQDGTDGVHYVADGRFVPLAESEEAVERWLNLYHYRKLRGATVPPIHMPRWASRILLEIVSVRVERLQDISEADAVAEGIEVVEQLGTDTFYKCYTDPKGDVSFGNPVASYRSLWAKINGLESWQANPWVWVVEFKRIAP